MDTKALRQKILDLAIHGKLVPQDPNDEPASVLLERIKAEKERLIKEGKIKRSKKSAKTSDTPHYPYLLPEGWEWCKLEDIVSFGGGKTPSMDNKEYWDNGSHLWVTSKDMKYSHITNSLMKITDKALEVMTTYKKGTLLVVTRSGILRHTLPLSILEKPATVNQDLKTISPHLLELSEYLYVVIKANEQFILKEYHKDGTTVDSIDFDKFKCLPIPLAPIAEQRRIIVETKHWFALIDQIEQGKTDLQAVIKQTKSKILDLAMHGKLVPQDPNDKPAFELLKRINPDFTPCDNGHSEKLPQNWVWVKGKNIFFPMKSTKPKNNEFQYIDIDSIDNKQQIINEIKTIKTPNAPSRASRYTQKNDVIFSMVRPYLRNIAKVVTNNCIASTGFYVCSAIPQILNSNYCYYLMVSDYVVNGLNQFMKGDNSPSINKGHIDEWLFPLPPLTEQQRIVQKIEELFSVLDNVQNALEV
ncbi:restriction endonuclease subunit S [Butyricimonas faecalis]|uniref:Restriction endonuclease subunit S n=2 Tax=Butyricimonas faecalis TaxID=2093856 RepID=A0A3Q9ITS4_9BACT|nr:restriction endonuclease subunit S [Butyricimonas faecalis]AZS31836.1 restriction endonuclease subunit S [Butyricimonas faecalis]